MARAVSAEYLNGHACAVLNQCEPASEAVTKEEIEELAELEIPMLYTAFQSARAVTIVRNKIVQAVKVACGHIGVGMTSAAFESLTSELCNHTAISFDADADADADADVETAASPVY
jgi:putative ribosome biogenesis GTPase RsgA